MPRARIRSLLLAVLAVASLVGALVLWSATPLLAALLFGGVLFYFGLRFAAAVWEVSHEGL